MPKPVDPKLSYVSESFCVWLPETATANLRGIVVEVQNKIRAIWEADTEASTSDYLAALGAELTALAAEVPADPSPAPPTLPTDAREWCDGSGGKPKGMTVWKQGRSFRGQCGVCERSHVITKDGNLPKHRVGWKPA